MLQARITPEVFAVRTDYTFIYFDDIILYTDWECHQGTMHPRQVMPYSHMIHGFRTFLRDHLMRVSDRDSTTVDLWMENFINANAIENCSEWHLQCLYVPTARWRIPPSTQFDYLAIIFISDLVRREIADILT